ncbi:hypothetical protein EV126DRAFT_138471 [Verticillium dahliae]|nr:hypothetical protein EV126DRAFT_138471 [Verticillium dahliae]
MSLTHGQPPRLVAPILCCITLLFISPSLSTAGRCCGANDGGRGRPRRGQSSVAGPAGTCIVCACGYWVNGPYMPADALRGAVFCHGPLTWAGHGLATG